MSGELKARAREIYWSLPDAKATTIINAMTRFAAEVSATPDPRITQLEADRAEACSQLATISTVAVMLLNHAQGCAMNHYGEDFQLYGMPGWLADAERDITAARATLSRIEGDGK